MNVVELQIVVHAVIDCDSEVRPELLDHIFLIGGTSTVGFCFFFALSIISFAPTRTNTIFDKLHHTPLKM